MAFMSSIPVVSQEKVRRTEGTSSHSLKARFSSCDNFCPPEARSWKGGQPLSKAHGGTCAVLTPPAPRHRRSPRRASFGEANMPQPVGMFSPLSSSSFSLPVLGSSTQQLHSLRAKPLLLQDQLHREGEGVPRAEGAGRSGARAEHPALQVQFGWLWLSAQQLLLVPLQALGLAQGDLAQTIELRCPPNWEALQTGNRWPQKTHGSLPGS